MAALFVIAGLATLFPFVSEPLVCMLNFLKQVSNFLRCSGLILLLGLPLLLLHEDEEEEGGSWASPTADDDGPEAPAAVDGVSESGEGVGGAGVEFFLIATGPR